MKKPRALKHKDRIALLAPASRVAAPSIVKRAEAIVRHMGFEPVLGKNVLATHGYMAGSDEERLHDLRAALQDDTVSAIWCLTGGYGTLPLLSHLPYMQFARAPKIVLGGDDISHLLLALSVKSGVVTFCGPNIDRVESKEAVESLKKALTSHEYAELCVRDGVVDGFCYAPVEGIGKGLTLPANLTALVSLFGTEYEPELAGRILFLEDRRERNDILDRWLTTLYVSGKLSSVVAVAMGQFENCDSRGAVNMLSFEELAVDRFVPMGLPCCFNFPFGQGLSSVLPIGIKASIDTSTGKLHYLENVLT